jgi:non-ribosomal peptide synthetase component F
MHSACALRAIRKSKGFKIINGYGPAENTVFTTCLIIEKEEEITNPVSIGKPIKETKVYLLVINNDY